MIEYLKLSTSPPPLEVQIVVKKSEFKIANEAKIEVLSGQDASREWHCESLISHGFDVWAFVNPEDAYEYEQRATERTSHE
jgi:hypothetical protein